MYKKSLRHVGAIVCALLAGVLLLAAVLILPNFAAASSHREAPLISKDPFADNTDTYVFIPEGQTENIVIVANWIPFELPEGGPNYYEWDDNAHYGIHIDVNGDAVADISYSLNSQTHVRKPLDTFLYNTGPIETPDDEDWNRYQTYSVTEEFAAGMAPSASLAPETVVKNVLVSDALAPPVNIGNKSTPNYESLMQDAIYTYSDEETGDEIRIFAGQADDPFWVDLQVFDLLTLRGQEPPVGYETGNNVPVDSLSGYNVHSLVLEIPISRLVRDGEPVLGVWADTHRPRQIIFEGLDSDPPGDLTAKGPLVQISRLGNPLVNEVVIPMGLKDTFNAIPPAADATIYGTLQRYVEDPEVGTLLCALYGVPLPGDSDADCHTEFTAGEVASGRGDLVSIFLQGIVLENEFTIVVGDGTTVTLPAGFNVNRPTDVVPAEMLRINTGISGTLCSPTPSRLGILGGDACGYPNGRRLTDDVVEISLLAVAGAAYPVLDGSDSNFSFNSGLIGVLDDNVNGNDAPFQDSFPYVAVPHSGQSHVHQNPFVGLFLPIIEKSGEAASSVSDAVSEHPLESAVAAAGGVLLFIPGLTWLQRRRKPEDDDPSL